MGLPWPGLWLKRLWVLLQVALHVAVGKVQLILFPSRVKQHITALNRKNPNFSYDNWVPTLFSTQYFWFILKFKRLIEDFSSIADFLIIYIEEAHASDGWAFKNNVNIRNHRNLQDRLQAARLLLDRSPQCPVVVDTMKNQSSQLYAALPERLYVLQGGRILYKGKPGPWDYHPEEVRAVLEKLHS